MSANNNGSRFGRRTPEPTGSEGAARSERSTNLEAARAYAAELIQQWNAASTAMRGPILIQIRSVQDQISGLRHRFPQLAARPSSNSWVDIWSPP